VARVIAKERCARENDKILPRKILIEIAIEFTSKLGEYRSAKEVGGGGVGGDVIYW